MAIEIVSFPIKNGDFPVRYVSLPEGTLQQPNMAGGEIHELPMEFSWSCRLWKVFLPIHSLRSIKVQCT